MLEKIFYICNSLKCYENFESLFYSISRYTEHVEFLKVKCSKKKRLLEKVYIHCYKFYYEMRLVNT